MVAIIGQALPAITQDYPYSTTMLYDWLEKCGISQEQAQELFLFDAVYNKFPGFDSKGGHKIPSQEQMDEYWPELSKKLIGVSKIWILGNVAKNYLNSKPITHEILYTIHPSYRNQALFNKNSTKIINQIKSFLC